MQGIRLFLYDSFGRLMVRLMGAQKAKYFFELFYWRYQTVFEGGKLKNDQYKAAYTDGFMLPESYFQNKTILDVGCGPRGSLEWAPASASCYGLDPLTEQYLKLNKGKHRMTYVQAGVEAIPFKADFFDLVSSFNSLDHVDDLDKALEEIKRVLKPGGDFLLIVDIHEKPALCEPVVISWDLPTQLADSFETITTKKLKRNAKVYQSLKEASEYTDGEYGILLVHFRKKQA